MAGGGLHPSWPALRSGPHLSEWGPALRPAVSSKKPICPGVEAQGLSAAIWVSRTPDAPGEIYGGLSRAWDQ